MSNGLNKADKITMLSNEIENITNAIIADTQYQNFKNKNLAGRDFSGQDLTGSNFVNANLTGANFSGARLDYCNFKNAKLDGIKFNSSTNAYGAAHIKHTGIKREKNRFISMIEEKRKLIEELINSDNKDNIDNDINVETDKTEL